ncbi:protein kinase [Okeanomitos corallinicola TIOX110]|uniref:non-specific serine/threonine protein kinase n=1 Tax=Okeanomitos corallinicola TIOX110 TaxID=3133117 RepID=A0ABZ2UXC0_9CYAN
MTNIYCSQGHQNPSGSKFCLQCGESILEKMGSSGIQAGQTLGDRYVIVRQLGQGGFGRTYLAEDLNRFREPCVLKEFSPQVQTPYVVQKAEELFQREASVLYKLQHPQIPRFRELLKINLQDKESLFLVQDHVAGETYNSLLNTRKQQGLNFTEIEVRQLLQQILPVLTYIHAEGVIHRDISPDNLMLRNADQLPVLIDFGGVKQVAATVSQYYQSGVNSSPTGGTLLGKIGFAPPEQMQTGMVSPHSDLYALAVTSLVLLTGKNPQELLDTSNLTWEWRREVSLSPELGVILDKMLSPKPSDRYQSARQVLDILNPATVYNTPPLQTPVNYSPSQPPVTSAVGTVAVSPAPPPKQPATPNVVTSQPQSTGIWTTTNILIVIVSILASGGLLWWGFNNRSGDMGGVDPGVTLTPTPTDTPTSDSQDNFSKEERERKQRLSDRRQQLSIDRRFYISLINQIFWNRNPSLNGRILTDEPKDEELRAEWDKVAAETLEKLTPISSRSRRQMGTYTSAERDRWKVEVNRRNVSSRALYDLGDAAFLRVFPEQKGKNFIDQPIGQVWHAFVNDKLNAILANSSFQKIVFDPNTTGKTVSGTLEPGNGKVFIAGLAKDQTLEVKLDASSSVLLSIYSPSGKVTFLEDSTQRNVSKTLPETGFYEFVVVSTGSKSVDYSLTVTAENPPEPEPEPTPTEEPTSEPTAEPTQTPIPSQTP